MSHCVLMEYTNMKVLNLLFLISVILAQEETTTTSNLGLFEMFFCPVLPITCPNKNVAFYLYTRDTQDDPQVLDVSDPNSIENATFLEDQPTKLIIHGYSDNHDRWPNNYLRPAYFAAYNYNIISVDYEPLSSPPCTVTTALNAPLVAKCTAQLIDTIVSSGKVPLESFHVIGLSLGAQVMAQISNYLESGKLERATGLDPALPFFGEELSLDEGDAKFVDVYHSDPGLAGKSDPCGTVDVYINKGLIQPGCENDIFLISMICTHRRAVEYYAESINPKGPEFIASPCTDSDCLLGDTYGGEDDKVVVGEHINKSLKGTYYVETNDKPPYIRG